MTLPPEAMNALDALLWALKERKPLVWNGNVLLAFEYDVKNSELWTAQAQMVLDADDFEALCALWPGYDGTEVSPDERSHRRRPDTSDPEEPRPFRSPRMEEEGMGTEGEGFGASAAFAFVVVSAAWVAVGYALGRLLVNVC